MYTFFIISLLAPNTFLSTFCLSAFPTFDTRRKS